MLNCSNCLECANGSCVPSCSDQIIKVFTREGPGRFTLSQKFGDCERGKPIEECKPVEADQFLDACSQCSDKGNCKLKINEYRLFHKPLLIPERVQKIVVTEQNGWKTFLVAYCTEQIDSLNWVSCSECAKKCKNQDLARRKESLAIKDDSKIKIQEVVQCGQFEPCVENPLKITLVLDKNHRCNACTTYCTKLLEKSIRGEGEFENDIKRLQNHDYIVSAAVLDGHFVVYNCEQFSEKRRRLHA